MIYHKIKPHIFIEMEDLIKKKGYLLAHTVSMFREGTVKLEELGSDNQHKLGEERVLSKVITSYFNRESHRNQGPVVLIQ